MPVQENVSATNIPRRLGRGRQSVPVGIPVPLGLSENYIYVVSFIMKVLFLLVVLAASVLAQVVQ